jgi:replication factor A2
MGGSQGGSQGAGSKVDLTSSIAIPPPSTQSSYFSLESSQSSLDSLHTARSTSSSSILSPSHPPLPPHHPLLNLRTISSTLDLLLPLQRYRSTPRGRELSLGLHRLTLLKGTYGKDTLRPCTILQVLSASQAHPDAEFSLDGCEINQVTIVGQIRNISSQATNITYKLDDGTGTLEVKKWVDADAPRHDENGDPISSSKELKMGEWARVWGRLKAFNNKRHVGAHVIRPIVDKNEINYHLLEATAVHLYFTRGPPEQFSTTDGGVGAGQQNATGNGYDANAGGGGMNMPNLSINAKKVMQFLRNEPQNNEGLHMQQIAAATQMTLPDVQKAGDELILHSLIFTTVDDHTWALLDM